jgi:hypothetical protein
MMAKVPEAAALVSEIRRTVLGFHERRVPLDRTDAIPYGNANNHGKLSFFAALNPVRISPFELAVQRAMPLSGSPYALRNLRRQST